MMFKLLHRHHWLSALIFLLPTLSWGHDNIDVDTLKVALNYNFAKYTQWPESQANEDLQLCYFNEAYGSNFTKLTNKLAGNRAIKITQLDRVQAIKDCDMVYLDNANKKLKADLLLAVQDKAILTVSDIDGFIDAGGMIEIFLLDDYLKFKVNLSSLQQAKLKLSSHVLKLAVEVRR